MKATKIIVAAITIALTLTLTLILSPRNPDAPSLNRASPPQKPAGQFTASRFLQQKARNPRAADHCHKDNEVCAYVKTEGRNTTCCNNKCMDLEYDDKNCGACKNKCAFAETCCRGECVNLAYDKRHCGSCNAKCMPNGFCIYGICDYA